jgi:hypothetical protein
VNNISGNVYTSSFKNIAVNGSRGLAYAYGDLSPTPAPLGP